MLEKGKRDLTKLNNVDVNQEKLAVCAHNLFFSCTVLQIDVPLHRQKEIRSLRRKKNKTFNNNKKNRKDRIMIKNVLVWMVQHTPITEFYAEA